MTHKLKMTRQQLAAFLKDHESIKQFESLFLTVDTVTPITSTDFEFAADTAQASARDALDQINQLTDDQLLAIVARIDEIESLLIEMQPILADEEPNNSAQVITWLSM